MLENFIGQMFGRSKGTNKNGNGKSSGGGGQPPVYPTGPYSSLSPGSMSVASSSMNSYYPSLPFDQTMMSGSSSAILPPSLPGSSSSSMMYPFSSPQAPQSSNSAAASAFAHASPLDSVPFEAQFTLGSSANLSDLDKIFRQIKESTEVIDRADAYLRSSQSVYDFNVETGVL